MGPVLGFTPTEIKRVEAELKLTLQQLLDIKPHQEYTNTPLQTLDEICVQQPKRFLPLAKKVKKQVESLRKEQEAAQWAGIPPKKLLQVFSQTA